MASIVLSAWAKAARVPCCSLIVLLGPWWLAEAQVPRNVDRAAIEAATVPLAQTIYMTHPSNGSEATATLYRALYYMNAITAAGGSPLMALCGFMERNGQKAAFGMLERQLQMDQSMAYTYGLFTPANLACLQAGVAPTATLGRSVGKRILVVKIRPADPDCSLLNAALCPEGNPLPYEAATDGNKPTPDGRFAGQRIQVPNQTMATSTTTTSLQTPPPTPPPYLLNGGTNTWTRGGSVAYPGTSQADAVTTAAAPNPANRVQLNDLPFNAMLPIDTKIKLGITRVEGDVITASILGEHEVLLQGMAGKNTYYPSVNKIQVAKKNPVRLPGVSANAYLLYTIPANANGPEMRWYFVDTTVDNGMVFRIARMVGPL